MTRGLFVTGTDTGVGKTYVAAALLRALAAAADVVVVEGAGGVRVPLGPGRDMLDIAGALGLPVLLVVGVRLGCLNHALLSADAIRGRGLRLSGWVANRIDPGMARADDSVSDLRARLPAPLVADLAWGAAGAVPAGALAALGLAPA